MKMKYFLPLFVLACVFLAQCSNEGGCLPEDNAAFYQEFRTIQIDSLDTQDTLPINYQFAILDGSSSVFQHIYKAPECTDVLDDEYGETLYFEIQEGIESFNLEDEELGQANAIISVWGAWTNSVYPVRSGTLIGEKQTDGSWDITADVKTEDVSIQKTFQRNFPLE